MLVIASLVPNKDRQKWIANLLIVCFFVWLFYFGWLITGIAFCDSDTCWLLAMGRWIIEHRQLPGADPFSAAVTAYASSMHMPLIQYQWFAEILFYLTYRSTGLIGLLVLNAGIACVTFVYLPYWSLVKANCSKFASLVIICTIVTLASFCLYIRPQIFSFLFFSLLTYLFVPTKNLLKKISWRAVLALLAIMFLWVNTHIFFPLGIAFIVLLLVAKYLEMRFIDSDKNYNYSLFLLPVAAFLPTLANPWGINIWNYAAQLSQHASSQWVTEMYPLNLVYWRDPIILSFFSLLLVYLMLCIFYRVFSLKKLGLVSPLLAIIGAYLSLTHCRLVPITSLFILAASAELASRQSDDLLTDRSTSRISLLRENIEQDLSQKVFNKYSWMGATCVMVFMGALLAFAAHPKTLPQETRSFKPPFAAIDFLKIHRPAGNVYNDPKFGSMMCWYMPNVDVFFDTRFSQYEPERMLDSLHTKNCNLGWEKTWNKYNFDWAFIKPSIPLAKALGKMGWQTAYADKDAVILTKPPG